MSIFNHCDQYYIRMTVEMQFRPIIQSIQQKSKYGPKRQINLLQYTVQINDSLNCLDKATCQGLPCFSFQLFDFGLSNLLLINNCALDCLDIIISKSAQKVMKPKSHKKLGPEQKRLRLRQFLLEFEDLNIDEQQLSSPYNQLGKYKYKIKLHQLANNEINHFEVSIEDLQEFFRRDEEKEMVNEIKSNVKHYINIFEDIVDENIPPRSVYINPEEMLEYRMKNILEQQRRQNIDNTEQSNRAQNQKLPSKLHRKYQLIISYAHRKHGMVKSIGQLNSDQIGSLVILKAMVVRTTETKPRIMVSTYACDVCGCENYTQVIDDKFNFLTKCNSKTCIENNVNGKLTFLTGHSAFKSSQQLKIQQTSDQIKQGNIPRSLRIHLFGRNVQTTNPGDLVQIQGVLIAKRKQGFYHEQDLIFEPTIEVLKIETMKKKYVEMQISEEDKQQIFKVRSNHTEEEIFQKLAKSIAPEIYGLQYVKKSLLLMMAGGVTINTADNLRIRGEINIALFGDPGIAKSQLLKHISYIAPRGIYTTGKGSSGVGLTAAIGMDPISKEVALEAGALVLADMGVCCIDEFDKMDQYDRTAIHEVMEQQTVSIAKAGITATLNARTSILAAANPLYGRYNIKDSTQKNINLPAALLSRFDIIFILLDQANATRDQQLAKHIGMVHKNLNAPKQAQSFSTKFLKNYIALSKQFKPTINESLQKQMIERYIEKRRQYADRVNEGERYITTRYLLGIIRLCQARAKLRFSNEITKEDILECEQLMLESQKNVSFEMDEKKLMKDDITCIYEMVKEICNYSSEQCCDYATIQKRVLARGYKEEVLRSTLIHYQNLDVLMIKKDGSIQIIEPK